MSDPRLQEHIGPLQILLIEDDPGDARLTRVALHDVAPQHELTVVADGHTALRYLRRQPPYRQVRKPDLILLDLNLPGMHGHEVLREIKADPALRSIPVNILTTSAREHDVLTSYERYANAYVTKPMDLDDYLEVLRQVTRFWSQTAETPEMSA
ncbi:MAG: response regulator [Nitriliruptoraceae bacterium]|nr:response regulator [Nitriliruptoraceae bacterium]